MDESHSTIRFYKSCVPFKGALLVLMWSALLQSSGLYFVSSIMLEYDSIWLNSFQPYFISLLTTKLLTLLSYPLAGLLAETVLTRFKVMVIGTVISLVGVLVAVVSLTSDTLYFYFTNYHTDVHGWKSLLDTGFLYLY